MADLTAGARKLRALISKHETDPEAARVRQLLLDTLKVEKQTLWTWISGDRRPGPHHRDAMALLVGIDAADWMTAAERNVVRRAEKVPGTGTDGT